MARCRRPPRALARIPQGDGARARSCARPRSSRPATTRRSSPAARRCRRRSATRILARLADLLGLPLDARRPRRGTRSRSARSSRELLRDERKVLGLYDTTITVTDPFPDRDAVRGPGSRRSRASAPAYTMAVNRLLRSEIGVETDREYALLSLRGQPGLEERRRAARVRVRLPARPTTSATGCRSTRT